MEILVDDTKDDQDQVEDHLAEVLEDIQDKEHIEIKSKVLTFHKK